MTYREYAPTPELRGSVRAYFSFTPGGSPWRDRRTVTREVRFTIGDSFCAPVFAAGHASVVVDLGAICHVGRGWTFGTPPSARAIGALRRVGDVDVSARAEMIGAYLAAGSTSLLLQAPAAELTDRVADLDQLWGPRGARLADDLAELDNEARLERFEAELLTRLRRATTPRLNIDVVGLARSVLMNPERMTVERLAHAAGVSRRHLTRLFRQVLGMSPKRYCRLARFHAGLAYAAAGDVTWAVVATELGYVDQSHMIAEFREFSGMTPEALATKRLFHPFMLDARSRVASSELGRRSTPQADV